MRQLYGLGLSVLVMVTSLAPSSAAPNLVTIDIPGAIDMSVSGINNQRLVVGDFRGADNNFHGFLWIHGAIIVIDVPGAESTELHGLNDRGDIVGTSRVLGEDPQGFLLQQGEFIPLVSPEGRSLFPRAINNRGDIVGLVFEGGSGGRGFRLDAEGRFESFTHGLTELLIQGINNSGVMVGGCCTLFTNLSRGVIIDTQETVTVIQAATFPVPGARDVIFVGINQRGDIVGQLRLLPTPPNRRSFVFNLKDGVDGMRFIEVPGALSTNVHAINRRGDVAGVYGDNVGFHGFVLREQKPRVRVEDEDDATD